MVIFDFDQTLVDTSSVQQFRKPGKWPEVMKRAGGLSCYAGITELISDIAASGRHVAIVTKSPDMVPKHFIGRLEWPVTNVVGFHDAKPHKPHPASLLEAARRAGIDPMEAVHIGDKPEDTIAAKAAGMLAIGAGWGTDDLEALKASGPDHLFMTVDELRAFLLQP